MFAEVVIFLGCAVVAVCISFHSMRDELPPKARLLCDIWRLVEGDEKHTDGAINACSNWAQGAGNATLPGAH